MIASPKNGKKTTALTIGPPKETIWKAPNFEKFAADA